MNTAELTKSHEMSIADELDSVRDLITCSLKKTSLAPMIGELDGAVGGGKMLRARLTLRVGVATGVPRDTLLRAAAAVEMVHAASLLHDDIIDGALIRRAAPSFWLAKGTAGAILLGDLFVSHAFQLLDSCGDSRLTSIFGKQLAEMCEAEAEQELVLRGTTLCWDKCLDIARRKTGALFASSACLCGGRNKEMSAALLEAGYRIGTAYQIADDVLDVYGSPDMAGKTLGTDVFSGKMTAASVRFRKEHDISVCIHELCDSSTELLNRWPSVAEAWQEYLSIDFLPVISALACTTDNCQALVEQ